MSPQPNRPGAGDKAGREISAPVTKQRRRNRFADSTQTRGFLRIFGVWAKWLIWLAPRAGFEPATIRLTVECSTAELPRNRAKPSPRRAAYNKASKPCKGRNGRCGCGALRGRKSAVPQRFVVPSWATKIAVSRCRRNPAAQPCRELTANSTQSPTTLDRAGFH